MKVIYQKAVFLLSVADIKQLPPDDGIEIAIVGRSNAGKSSVLNALTHSKRLARVSKTPGRTQQINLFGLDETRRLADLPGYGFAQVPLKQKIKWHKTIEQYFANRLSLKGLLLIMDIRHPMKALDKQLLDYCEETHLPVHILLNKADKLSKGAAQKTLTQVESLIMRYGNSVSIQTFSAKNGTGLKQLIAILDNWYQL